MKFVTGSLIFAIIVALTTSKSIETDPTKVYLPDQGEVLGSVDETSWTNQKFFSFRGIPYAESPSGMLRFQPPESRTPWNKTHDARSFGKICPVWEIVSTYNASQLKEDLEDCLNLSVYSKSLEAKQPVMFYIHGGAFGFGSAADYPPHYLLEKDIVLVVAQYRVGSLGFMTTFTNEMPGNVAIMDMQFALNWVQKYIHLFGGDPTKVTIFGQSAGAGMTSAIVLSPKTSEDYFKRSIVQSSSILAPWCLNRLPLQQVKRVCEALGCKSCDDRTKQNECMIRADLLELLTAASQERLSPVVGDVNGVLPDEPKTLLENFNRTIPLMTGFTKHDGSFLLATKYDSIVQQYGSISNVTVRQFANILIDTSEDNSGLANNLFLRILFKQEMLDTNNHTAAWPAYFDIVNDANIKSPVITYANGMRGKVAPVYMYTFDYAGEFTRFGYDSDASKYPFEGGVHHSNDNIYLFNTFSLNSNDTALAKKMVDLWYSFAVDGEPKIVDEPELNIKPMETDSGPYFHINKEVTFGSNILKELTATMDDPDSYKLIKTDSLNSGASGVKFWWGNFRNNIPHSIVVLISIHFIFNAYTAAVVA